MVEPLETISPGVLQQLAALCREHLNAPGLARHAIQQVVGPLLAGRVGEALDGLRSKGWTLDQVAYLIEQIAAARQCARSAEHLFDLVLSGPEVEGIPTRETAAVMQGLFGRAEREVLLVGYAVHGGQELFSRLAERMRERPDLNVWMCLDIPRRSTDTSLDSQIVRRFAADFFARQWPWEIRPRLFYDVRSLSNSPGERASLHAKCVVVDRRVSLITSANFTTAAQTRNIEAGVVIEYEPFVTRVAEYFEGLRAAGILRPVNA